VRARDADFLRGSRIFSCPTIAFCCLVTALCCLVAAFCCSVIVFRCAMTSRAVLAAPGEDCVFHRESTGSGMWPRGSAPVNRPFENQVTYNCSLHGSCLYFRPPFENQVRSKIPARGKRSRDRITSPL